MKIDDDTDANTRVFIIIEFAKLNNLYVYEYLVYLLIYLHHLGTDTADKQLESVIRGTSLSKNIAKFKIGIMKSH